MQFSRKTAPLLGLAALAALGLTARAAHAGGNLVKDGDFEQADLGAPAGAEDFFIQGSPFDAYWSINDIGAVAIDTNSPYVLDGSKSLYLNAGVTAPVQMPFISITQNLATVAGQAFTLSFIADGGAPDALLNVSFGGTTLAPITVPINNGLFTAYSFQVTATSAFTGLTFSSGLDNGAIELDDISVTPVPETSTTVSFGLLLALGIGGLALTAYRTHRRSAR